MSEQEPIVEAQNENEEDQLCVPDFDSPYVPPAAKRPSQRLKGFL